ncbi:hypothetical protein ABVT39_020013 [Epinephelus coioides]
MRTTIVLYKLASCAEYRVIANQFGVHKSMVKRFVYCFCKGMVSSVIHKLIKVPTVEEACHCTPIPAEVWHATDHGVHRWNTYPCFTTKRWLQRLPLFFKPWWMMYTGSGTSTARYLDVHTTRMSSDSQRYLARHIYCQSAFQFIK